MYVRVYACIYFYNPKYSITSPPFPFGDWSRIAGQAE